MGAVFSIMKNTLESSENLKISGFGSFIVKQKRDRRRRNRDGENRLAGPDLLTKAKHR